MTRARVFKRAAQAWTSGQPHRAWVILAEAGMTEHWAEFHRTALTRARSRYVEQMSRYR